MSSNTRRNKIIGAVVAMLVAYSLLYIIYKADFENGIQTFFGISVSLLHRGMQRIVRDLIK